MTELTHPVTEFINTFFAPSRVILQPELYYQLATNISIPFEQVMKNPNFNQKFTQYGENAFVDALNRSETACLMNNLIQLKLKHRPLTVCVCQIGITAIDLNELLKQFQIVKIELFSIMAALTFDESLVDKEALKAVLEQAGVKKINFQSESLRDAFMREAIADGVSNEEIKVVHAKYHAGINAKAVASKPKGVYDMNTEQFKKESGYGKDFKVQPAKIREFIKDVQDGNKEWKKVEMLECCAVSKNAAKRMWCSDKKKPEKKVEKTAEEKVE